MTVPPTSLPPAPTSRAASPVYAYAGIPLSGLLGVVLLAWLHERLGSPLGAGWGAELWGLVKTGVVVITPAYVGLAYAVQKHNARVEALYDAHRAHELSSRLSSHDGPAQTLTAGRRLPTASHPALSTSRALVVVEPEDDHERRGGEE